MNKRWVWGGTNWSPYQHTFPDGIAVGPLPRVPISKDQCTHGGWHNFPQFKNQGQCVAFVEHGK